LLARALDNDPNYFATAAADRAEVVAGLVALTGVVDTKVSTATLAAATATLQGQINTKASGDAVDALRETVDAKAFTSDLATATATLQGQINTKASGDYVTALAETVGSKASSTDLAAATATLQGQIATKASGDYVTALAETVASKASSTDLAAATATLQGQIATKASGASVTALAETVASKASQARLDFVGQNFQPRVTAFAPLSLVPRSGPQDNPFSELSVDLGAYATTAALGTKADAASVYTKAQVGAAIAAADSNLTAGTAVGGHPVLANGVVRALRVLNPLKLAPDTSLLEIRLDQGELAATPQIAALQAAVATKQDALAAGSSLVFHEPLLQDGRVKSLVAGAGVTLSSTSDLVTLSALPSSAPGGAGNFSLVGPAGEILRLRPGSGAYALQHTGAVELGVVTQGAQFLAPFSVMDAANGTALRARVSETRVEFFRDTVVNGSLSVTGLSEFQSVEAVGVVAEQVVWVKGVNTTVQSIMFPGSLQLGKWRTRGNEAGRFVLERFDDDGTTQTNGWVTELHLRTTRTRMPRGSRSRVSGPRGS
jgi:hypothetical protein